VARALTLVVAAVLALTAGACDSDSADKAGGQQDVEPRVLTLANANFELVELQAWADEVERLSDGRLQIRARHDWRKGDPQAEAGLIRDVKAGQADLGWVGSRAWTAEGVTGLDALHAPFLVDDYELERAILEDPIAERMLEAVGDAGVEGVALLPGPMRYLLTREPVDHAAALTGATIAISQSKVAEASLRLLGARSVPIASGEQIAGQDGVEQQLEALHSNRHSEHVRYLMADAPLWPRPFVIFANWEVWQDLDAEQRDVLREAADGAMEPMLERARTGDREGLVGLCASGVRLVQAGADVRSAFRRMVEPVYEQLRRDVLTREVMSLVERARTEEISAGTGLPACSERRETTGLPTGVYRAKLHADDEGAENVAEDFVGGPTTIYELRLDPTRALITAHHDDGTSEVGFDELYTVYRDRVTFGGAGDLGFSARFELDGDKLTFSDFESAEAGDEFVWGTHPWIRARR
jgi:TRAP-type C4-dicarboxylate transport system substrate-binding protein